MERQDLRREHRPYRLRADAFRLREHRDDTARVNHQRVATAVVDKRRDANRQRRAVGLRQIGVVEPGRVAFDAYRFTGQQIRHEVLALFQIRKHVAIGRVQQAGAEAQFAACRDRGGNAQRLGNAARQHVDARQSAEQRDHGAAVFRDGQHRRLRPLVAQHRGDAADDDARRAQGDDRCAARVQRLKMLAELGEAHVGIVADAGVQSVDDGVGQTRLKASCSLERAAPEHDDGRRRMRCTHLRAHPCHFCPGTTSNEKYGEALGSTSASGTMR